jgi:hypothetical protein
LINLPSPFIFIIMGLIRPLKLGLLIYEIFKIILLAAAFASLQSTDPAIFPWLLFAVSGVLYPLMAMFLWLDINRYRGYLPLFAAGKITGIIVLLGWFIVSPQDTMIMVFSGRGSVEFIELVLMSGLDFLAIAAVLLMIRKMRPEIDVEEK